MASLLVVLLGMLGLAFDLGRVYIVRKELQTYAHAAAYGAALPLNGLQSGIDDAKAVLDNSPNKYHFGTVAVPSANRKILFAPTKTGDASGNWHEIPSSGQIRQEAYVKVSVGVPLPLYFLPVVKSPSPTLVATVAVAGRVETNTAGGYNVLPYAPLAIRPTPTTSDSCPASGTRCAGRPAKAATTGPRLPAPCVRVTMPPAMAHRHLFAAECDGSGSRILRHPERRHAIDTGYPDPISVGDTIYMASGAKNGRKQAMEDRVDSDTGNTSTTYAQYENNRSSGARVGNGGGNDAGNGNGNSGGGNGDGSGNGAMTPRTVIGFAAFFFDSLNYDDTHGSEPYCAQYIGAYEVRLVK